MTGGYTFFKLDLNIPIHEGAGQDPKLIAVKKEATESIKAKCNASLQTTTVVENTVVEPAAETMESIAPTNVVAGAEFQAPPAELAPTNAPVNEMIQPLDLNAQMNTTTASSSNDVVEVNIPSTTTPIELQNTNNLVTDENIISQISEVLDKYGMNNISKEQVILSVKMGLNNDKLIKKLDDIKLEAADVAKTTSELAQANMQNIQSQTINPAATQGQTLTYQNVA